MTAASPAQLTMHVAFCAATESTENTKAVPAPETPTSANMLHTE